MLTALLAWAEAHTHPESGREQIEGAARRAKQADPGMLRALVVAWAVRPDLTRERLPDWLQTHLSIATEDATLDAAIDWLREEKDLDAPPRLRQEQMKTLINAWGLRAWVREVQRLDRLPGG